MKTNAEHRTSNIEHPTQNIERARVRHAAALLPRRMGAVPSPPMRRPARLLLAFARSIGLRALVVFGAVALGLGIVGSFRHVEARIRFSGDPAGPLIAVAVEPWVLHLGTIRLEEKGSEWESVQQTQIRFWPNEWRGALWKRIGFQQRTSRVAASDGTVQRFRSIWLPLWPPVVVAGAIVAAWFRRRVIPDRRAKAGLCIACGYDLRASQERCPECGTAPKATTA
jgi:hypothetical protein